MAIFSKDYHPLDSRHPANRATRRTLEAERETFRNAEKSQTLRHFFLPPNATKAQARLETLQRATHLSERQKYEVRQLEGRLYELDRDRVKRETVRNTPWFFKLFLSPVVEAYALFRGQRAVRGRKERDKWTIIRVLLILLVLLPVVMKQGGIGPAIRSLADFSTQPLLRPLTELDQPDLSSRLQVE